MPTYILFDNYTKDVMPRLEAVVAIPEVQWAKIVKGAP
jgi:hypothetical protein